MKESMDGNVKLQYRIRFWMHPERQWSYGQIDGVVGFSTSNRSRNHLDIHSNCRWRGPWMVFKNRKIGHAFDCATRTSGDTAKWIASFDSAHQRGLWIHSKEVLIVDEGFRGYRFKNCEFGDVFASALRTSGDTAKRKPPLDSANRIRLFTPRTGAIQARRTGSVDRRIEIATLGRFMITVIERTEIQTGIWYH